MPENSSATQGASTPDEAVAELLEQAAALITASPGLNALDAFAQLSAPWPEEYRAAVVASAYWQLLDYLPNHTEWVAAWSDTETSERVAGKLVALARTVRRGGPARIEDQPYVPAPPEADDVLGHTVQNRKGSRAPTSELARLQRERGVMLGAITRAERARHPDVAKLTENRLRLEELNRSITELEAAEHTAAEHELHGGGGGGGGGPHEEERGRQLVPAGAGLPDSWSGL